MKKIICQVHRKSYSLIRISLAGVKLICLECKIDCQENLNKTNGSSIINLQKTLNSPQYFLLKANLLNDSPQLFENLSKIEKNEYEKQSRFLEQKVSFLQRQLEDLVVKIKKNEFEKQSKFLEQIVSSLQQQLQDLVVKIQQNMEFAIQLRNKLKSELKEAIQYQQFEELIDDLEKEKDSTNPDIIQQIESSFQRYFSFIKDQITQGMMKKIKMIIEKFAIYLQEFKLKDQSLLLMKRKSEFTDSFFAFCDQAKTNLKFEQLQLNIKKSNILSDEYHSQLYTLIEQMSAKKIRQQQTIYIGTRDGLNIKAFWSKVEGKRNLLMIFKQAYNNYVFGAYSPCQWLQDLHNFVQDETFSSFLFSQTRKEIYPLKKGFQQYAIYCNSDYGPFFGQTGDLYIGAGFITGLSKLGGSYQWNQQQNQQDDHPLFGCKSPNIVECEIIQLDLE